MENQTQITVTAIRWTNKMFNPYTPQPRVTLIAPGSPDSWEVVQAVKRLIRESEVGVAVKAKRVAAGAAD